MSAGRRTSGLLGLIALLVLSSLAGCGGAQAPQPQGPQPQASERAAVCPPCRMDALPEYEVIEVDGLRFSVCNPRCAEITRADASRFTGDALP